MAAAAEAGNPRTQANLQRAETLAAEGDPRGIEAMGKLAACEEPLPGLEGATPRPRDEGSRRRRRGRPPPAASPSPRIASMQEKAAAATPRPSSTWSLLPARPSCRGALASNPKAQEEWKEKRRASSLGLTENEDVAVGPPLLPGLASSLPDLPLPPIRSFLGLLKASARALTLATRDPFQNYREGVRSRDAESSNVSTAGAAAPTTRAEGSSLDARAMKVLEDALKSKTITQADFEQLRKKEKSPGSAPRRQRGGRPRPASSDRPGKRASTGAKQSLLRATYRPFSLGAGSWMICSWTSSMGKQAPKSYFIIARRAA